MEAFEILRNPNDLSIVLKDQQVYSELVWFLSGIVYKHCAASKQKMFSHTCDHSFYEKLGPTKRSFISVYH